MLLLVLDERVEEHLRDVRDPHAKTAHAVDHVAGLVPFADRVQLSGFVRTHAESDKAGGSRVKSVTNENPDQYAEERDAHQIERGRMGLTARVEAGRCLQDVPRKARRRTGFSVLAPTHGSAQKSLS